MKDSGLDFHWPVRVYHEDVDTFGFVYYANYLKFMERARTEWLRVLGFEQTALRETDRIVFAVSTARVSYRRPAKFNDRLNVGVRISRFRAASMTLRQPVLREPQEPICHAEITLACLDADSHRPRGIPSNLLAELRKA